MTRPVRLALVAALIALVVTGALTRGFGLIGRKPADTLTLYGNVDIRQVDLGFRVPGRIAAIPFDEGARVPAGAVLATLDPRPLGDKLASAEAKVAAAEAELAKRRAGSRPQEVATAAADLAQRQAVLAGARDDYERRKPLIETGAVSQALFDQTKAAYAAAQANVRAAQQALSLQRAGSRREDITAAEAQLALARAERDTVRTDIADAKLRAPSAGVLLSRAREPGAIVGAGETVFTLTIDRPMRVRAYVAEPDLGRIRPGMAVEVSTGAGRRRYHGTIGYISPTAEFTPKTVETENLRTDLVYRLRIIVTDPDDGLRQGQPVTVIVPDAPVVTDR
ncbi:MAG: secretion protein HlyD [Sphingomonas sp. 28-66-16]|nr:MAG: secretion protein HlyD [Sphingomonas sp. 28-66-16]